MTKMVMGVFVLIRKEQMKGLIGCPMNWLTQKRTSRDWLFGILVIIPSVSNQSIYYSELIKII